MTAKFALLNEAFLLRGWKDMPHALVNASNGEVSALSSNQFRVLQACDGNIDLSSLYFPRQYHSLLAYFAIEDICKIVDCPTPVVDYQRYRVASNSFIRHVLWSITGRCNFKCLHCLLGDEANTQHLSHNECRKVIDSLTEANVPCLSLSGGEPLMRKDFFELLKIIKYNRIHLASIMSNAFLLDESKISDILELGLSPVWQISYDGSSTHDIVRNFKGAELDVLNKLGMINKSGMKIVISTTVTDEKMFNFQKTFSILRDCGINYWRIQLANDTGRWKINNCGPRTKSIDHSAMKNWIEIWDKEGRPFGLDIDGIFSSQADFDVIQSASEIAEKPVCSEFADECYIDPQGKVLPCSGFGGTALANSMPSILKEGLSNIWENSNLSQLRKTKKSEIIRRNKGCRECEHLPYCELGCRANAYYEHGDILDCDRKICDAWRSGNAKGLYETAHLEKICVQKSIR